MAETCARRTSLWLVRAIVLVLSLALLAPVASSVAQAPEASPVIDPPPTSTESPSPTATATQTPSTTPTEVPDFSAAAFYSAEFAESDTSAIVGFPVEVTFGIQMVAPTSNGVVTFTIVPNAFILNAYAEYRGGLYGTCAATIVNRAQHFLRMAT